MRPANFAFALIVLSVLIGCDSDNEDADAPRVTDERQTEQGREKNDTRAVDETKDLTKEQQLVFAAFDLDVQRVKQLLADGINVNAVMGNSYSRHLFGDKWSGALSPIGSHKWTPLMAVAWSNREPPPAQPFPNTLEGIEKAEKERRKVKAAVIKARDKRRVEIGQMLLRAGAAIDPDDGHGSTALLMAAENGYEELALLLIEHGANVNVKTTTYIDDPGGYAPIHYAARHPKVLKALLGKGAEVDVRDGDGCTPLFWAVGSGSEEGVRILLDAGADPSAKDHSGKTCLQKAEDLDDVPHKKKMLKLLRNAMAAPQTSE